MIHLLETKITLLNTDAAFGVFVWNEIEIQKIIKYLKSKKFPGRIILGGPQISYVKSNIEKYYLDGDIFIRGYAEDALVQFKGFTMLVNLVQVILQQLLI